MKRGTIADFQNKVIITVHCQDADECRTIERAIKPLEIEMRFSRGFVDIMHQEDLKVTIVGHARDIASLRSLVNGLCKCLYLVLLVQHQA